ncbi:MAG TPA: sn-glycerol-3-phosphate ABC transporter ATP-binding protein UgpC [Phycisphaerales bacterium]|nr:sn-glycerol-3-phosphate ABC transporter ATP-binding protein UgpC [Phycisphaerales bacterium]
MATLTLANVEKKYPNGHHAVRGFSLDILDGEFIVLVGPSGCGKSTVLRMIAGLEDITSGTISIDSTVVNDLAPKDRNIAMVFQNYALYPHMTVRKNMAFALSLRGTPQAEIDTRVTNAAKALAIGELLDRKPGQLSGGQRQRVALGRAIVRDPKVALFDEPLSNLDAKLRVATRAELKSLHQRLKTTSVYVTHDQEEAMTLGDRIVVMSNGLIQQVDTPINVYQRPANRFVAAFVGMPPMNFIEGHLKADGGLWFESGTLRCPAPSHAQALKAFVGRSIVLGLRPQAIALHAAAAGGWPATIRVIEPLGDLMDVSLSLDGTSLVARVPLDGSLTPGQSVAVLPNLSLAHWFAPGEFGERLA